MLGRLVAEVVAHCAQDDPGVEGDVEHDIVVATVYCFGGPTGSGSRLMGLVMAG